MWTTQVCGTETNLTSLQFAIDSVSHSLAVAPQWALGDCDERTSTPLADAATEPAFATVVDAKGTTTRLRYATITGSASSARGVLVAPTSTGWVIVGALAPGNDSVEVTATLIAPANSLWESELVLLPLPNTLATDSSCAEICLGLWGTPPPECAALASLSTFPLPAGGETTSIDVAIAAWQGRAGAAIAYLARDARHDNRRVGGELAGLLRAFDADRGWDGASLATGMACDDPVVVARSNAVEAASADSNSADRLVANARLDDDYYRSLALACTLGGAPDFSDPAPCPPER